MSDNDLIRRGDALKAFDWGDIYGRNAQDAINAIPAVQPTVSPDVTEQPDEHKLTGIWPDFFAPSKYEAPDPRWTDPGLPNFRLVWKLAREVGYSIGLHGSMKRDCDLIAAPWTAEAVSADDLIDHLCKGLNAFKLGDGLPAVRPHGRLAWAIQIRDAYKKYMDISVMPLAHSPDVAALVEALSPLSAIADAYDENELDDEARKLWGKNLEHENRTPLDEIEIFAGRGGKRLLTLEDAMKARAALARVKGETK